MVNALEEEKAGQTWQAQRDSEGLPGTFGGALNQGHAQLPSVEELFPDTVEAGDMESYWAMSTASIVDVATWSCGHKVDQLYSFYRVLEGPWVIVNIYVYVDTEKAFNRLPHDVLLGSMESEAFLRAIRFL